MADKKYKTYYIEKRIIPIGSKEITQNGIYNVENCSRAHVRVQGGGSSVTDLNIHCSTTEPEDTSKLWIKTDAIPTSIDVTNDTPGTTEYNLSVGINSVNPVEVSKRHSVVYEGKIYVYNDTVFNILNPDNNSMEIVSTNIGVSSGSILLATVVGDNIHFYTSSALYVYNPKTNTVVDTITISSSSSTNILTYAVRVGDKIYSFDAGYSSLKGRVFDMNTNTSSDLGDVLPRGGLNMDIVAVGNKIYLIGGKTGSASFANTIIVYDITTNTAKLSDVSLPASNNYMECAVFGSDIYVFGGCSGTSTINGYGSMKDTIVKIDTVNNTCVTLNEVLPIASIYINACVYGSRIYLFGGFDKIRYTSTYYADIHMFTIAVPLEENKLSVLTTSANNKVTIYDNGIAKVEVGISKCLLGNSENIAEVIPCAVHNGTEWVEV